MLARASVDRARPPGGAFLATGQSWKQSACDVMGEGSAVAAEADGAGRYRGAAGPAAFAASGSDWEVMVVSELLGKRVLLAIDGSEGTEVAARAAAEVAEGTGSALHLVYVEPLPDFVKNGDGAPGYDRELYKKIEEGARERLRKLAWRVKAGGGTVTEAHLRMGAVAEEIVGLADELGAGLIVVGSRGLGRMRRALVGSVSEGVLRRARRPVMVVRATQDAPPGRRGGRPRARRVLSQDWDGRAAPWRGGERSRGRIAYD
jgi:nucleotide-binding universal stress UspA family protein